MTLTGLSTALALVIGVLTCMTIPDKAHTARQALTHYTRLITDAWANQPTTVTLHPDTDTTTITWTTPESDGHFEFRTAQDLHDTLAFLRTLPDHGDITIHISEGLAQQITARIPR